MRWLAPILLAAVLAPVAAHASAECLQAPGLDSGILLNFETFCPLTEKARAVDIFVIDREIKTLAEKFKNVDPEEGEGGALASLYFGFQDKLKWAQESGDAFAKLSRQEVFALYDYIEWGYQTINPLLWSGRGDDKARAEARLLTSALNKLPAYQGIVYRGEIDPRLKEEMDVLQKRLKTLNEGSEFQFRSFMSTTIGSGSEAREMYTEKRVIVYEIQSKSGRHIAPLSSRDWEEEVLFRPSTWFNVISVEKVSVPKTKNYPLDYQWRVKLEEI